MVFGKLMAKRLLNVSRIGNQAFTHCRTSSPRTAVESAAFNHRSTARKFAPDPGDNGIFRRFLHRKAAGVGGLGVRFLPTGEKLLEKLQAIDVSRDRRIRLDGLFPPAPSHPEAELTVSDASKILRLWQLESVRARLKRIEKDVISYSQFLDLCAEGCSDPNQALEFAKRLDESGNVIVIGNAVFVRPEQVVKAVQSLIPPLFPALDGTSASSLKELDEMEKEKAAIEAEAKVLVRRELWSGLGCLMVQTAAFMRLTFWDLTWDVMEPICFYVTSLYFISGYAFFLRTSKEPTFEGFYQSRLEAKQKKLMKIRNFDSERYQRL
ncbi:hypothetical protein M569_04531, partial [Genlisea aurea]